MSRPRLAEVVAENLRALALDPLTLSLISPDVQVYRRRENGHEVFYFSPAAYLFFKPFVLTYQGTQCARPVPTHDEHELRRLSLRSEEVWKVIRPGEELSRPDEDFPH